MLDDAILVLRLGSHLPADHLAVLVFLFRRVAVHMLATFACGRSMALRLVRLLQVLGLCLLFLAARGDVGLTFVL